jgi:hypothetical protein
MTLFEIQEKLYSFVSLPTDWDQQKADPPNRAAIETAWKLAKLAVTRFQFNPTNCVPSKDGGVALVWLHPVNQDRYADVECCNDTNVRACLSSKEHSVLEEWQLQGFGVPIIGEHQRPLDDSFARIKHFLQSGLLV